MLHREAMRLGAHARHRIFNEDQGTTFILDLPCVDKAVHAEEIGVER